MRWLRQQEGGRPTPYVVASKENPCRFAVAGAGHTELCIKTLAGIVQNGESESARVTAAGILLDRGWGKAPTTHTGVDGEGDVRVVIRHIVEGRDVPRVGEPHTIEHELDAAPINADDQ